MIQKKYCFHTFEELEKIIGTITSDENYHTATSVLMQLFNPKIDADDKKIVEYINSSCSNACLIGITCANISEEKYDIKDNPIELNVTYFYKTKLIELDFDIEKATGFVAGRILNEQLYAFPDVCCVEVFYNCNSATIHSFINEFSHHQLPIFGIKAGRSIRALNPAKIYGKRCSTNGIIVVMYESKDLHLYMDNSLGFKEIGVEMAVTKAVGDDAIAEIDHNKATDIYAKYLKVNPNKYFVQHVCEFPLIFRRRNCRVARVPFAYEKDGTMRFGSDVSKGETFRLSYGSPDNLFKITEKSISNLKQFKPEAIFLFECGNRMRFLKDLHSKQSSIYNEVSPNISIPQGYGELFITPSGDGGVLNAVMVTIGLTEESDAQNVIIPSIELIDDFDSSQDDREFIPFTERILNFLERTSLELDSINKELGKIAYTDQLTKIYNRWELERKLDENLGSVKSDGASVALIFMDIDHFKKVNDTFGHDVGDMVLRAVVNIVKEKLKKNHVFGRWGGEEFIYILPDTDLQDAAIFAEELRNEIDKTVFVLVHHVTMSFGVTIAKPSDDSDIFVKRADNALYEAKQTGRNKVVTKL